MSKQVVQISPLPGGGGYVAPISGSLRAAVDNEVGHYQEHSARGGYVGIAPLGRGVVVQLHAADGRVEGWTAYRYAR